MIALCSADSEEVRQPFYAERSNLSAFMRLNHGFGEFECLLGPGVSGLNQWPFAEGRSVRECLFGPVG